LRMSENVRRMSDEEVGLLRMSEMSDQEVEV